MCEKKRSIELESVVVKDMNNNCISIKSVYSSMKQTGEIWEKNRSLEYRVVGKKCK